MALVLYRPLFWVSLLLLALLLLWLARRVNLRWKPAWFLRVALAALILFILFFPRGALFREPLPARQVLLLDMSDSIAPEIRTQLQQQALAWRQGALNRVVIAYGADVQVAGGDADNLPDADGRASNLSQALDAAAGILGSTPGVVYVASEGEASDPLAVDAAVARLAEEGHTLHALPLAGQESQNDVYVAPPVAPSVLWEQTPFSVVLPVYAATPTAARVQLSIDGELAEAREVQLAPGENAISFDLRASGIGLVSIASSVSAENDSRAENNESFATSQVYAAPRVLYVNNTGENALTEILQAGGIELQTIRASELPADLAQLEQYQVIVLDNLLARHLSSEQQVALDVFVSRLGGGLLLIGGHNSYTLGGYRGTPLASMLPLEMEPPARSDRPPVTFAIILDRSESMGSPQPDIPPLDLAQEAAMRAIEVLTEDDYVGVMTYGSDFSWEVPLSRVGEGLALRQAQDAISAVQASGVTNMYSALSEALRAFVATQPTEHGLFLVLSDGQSTDGTFEEFQIEAVMATEEGITISTIAMGLVPESIELMEMIATEAGGRFHHVTSAAELPRIMVAEGEAARSENVQSGEIHLSAGEEAHPVPSGFRPAELPPLSSYIALSSRSGEGAEDILVSGGARDPVLSAWQHGLGRVMVWTGDNGSDWAAEWQTWPKADIFWAQVIRYALLNPAAGPAQVQVDTSATELAIRARLQGAAGLPLNGAAPELVYDSGADQLQALALAQRGPGLYEAKTAQPAPGAYKAVLRYEDGEQEHETAAAFAINYPAEWRPTDATNSGQDALERWAADTDGDVIGWNELVAAGAMAETGAANEGSLLERLILAALIFWPVEVAIRRRWLPWH